MQRAEEEQCQAKMAQQADAACQHEEAERQRKINEVRVQMEQEWEQELQAWSQAIMATQGSGTPGPLMVAAVLTARVCEQCTILLQDTEGCMVSIKGKAQACVPCQKVHKACNWPLGLADVTMVTGSGTEGSGKLAPRAVVKRKTQAMTNASPRGGEKHKKVCTTMEEGKDNEDDIEEVFRVSKVMVEEQHDVLGMLTQTLAQMEE